MNDCRPKIVKPHTFFGESFTSASPLIYWNFMILFRSSTHQLDEPKSIRSGLRSWSFIPFLSLCIVLSTLNSVTAISLVNTASGQILIRNVTVEWSGGDPKCSSCSWGGTLVDSFACSSYDWEWNAGDWDNGTKTFHDPLERSIPHTYTLSQISVLVRGIFDCRNWSYRPTILRLFLQDILIHEWSWEQLRLCVCANCQEEITFTTKEIEQWPGYVYGGENAIRVEVLNNVVCLSAVEMEMAFLQAPDAISLTTGQTILPEDDDDVMRDIIFFMAAIFGGLIVIIGLVGAVFVIRKLTLRSEYDLIGDTSLVIENGSQKKIKITGRFQVRGDELALGPRIGKGSYGDVYRAEWRGIDVAVKKLPAIFLDKQEFLKDFNSEATIMSSLRHPNVLQFLGTCVLDSDICIITEFMSHGSVYRILHDEKFKLDLTIAKRFALETAQGMLYLHHCIPTVLHRDLKSHNLLCDDSYKVKISDFGLSKVIDHCNRTMTSCGTAAWAAPEVLKNSRYTEKADVYSFGICLWEFCTRKDPYEGMPSLQIVYSVGSEGLRPIIPEHCPLNFSQLIRECWDEDPDVRPTFQEIVARLKEMEVPPVEVACS